MSDARATGTWLVADEEEAPAPQPVEEVKKKEPIPGFYAGTAKEVLPPPRNRRRPVAFLVVGLVGAAAGGALLVGLGGDDPETAATAPPAPAASSTPASSAPAGPSGSTPPPEDEGEGSGSTATTSPELAPIGSNTQRIGAVASEVVEVSDPGWYVSGNRFGSYGFVVENTSDEVLGSFIVRVKAYDRSGKVISGLDAWKHVIGTMQPYQKLVVADELHNEAMAANGVSRLEVDVVELSDDPTPDGPSPAEVPLGTVAVGAIERSESIVRTQVSYRAVSSYDVPLDANAYLVFRDAEGVIVGGASSFVDLPAQGTVAGDFDVRNEVVSPETTSIEVYVVPRLPL